MVLAATATGAVKVTSCHPVLLSPVNTALARLVPPADHSEPVWVPVLSAVL